MLINEFTIHRLSMHLYLNTANLRKKFHITKSFFKKMRSFYKKNSFYIQNHTKLPYFHLKNKEHMFLCS